MFEFKKLSLEAVPAALEKALRYRLLNMPEIAASICEDVLAVDPENQEALVTLLLAMTDSFDSPRPVPVHAARDLLHRLHGAYEREYYSGIIWEREAIAWMRSNRTMSGPAAFDCFIQAMFCFERAEALRPPANDEALLRWNSCARLIMSNRDVCRADEVDEIAANLGE